MMKKILYTILILLAVATFANASYLGVLARTNASSEHCGSLGWTPDLTDFVLDFDNETPEQACEDAADGETGVKVNATISTPGLVSPLSGGAALDCDGDTHYIDFDNTNSFVISTYGEFMFTFTVAGNNTSSHELITIRPASSANRVKATLEFNGILYAHWEDNNSGTDSLQSGLDVDSGCGGDCYGHWIQVHVKWDTERCTDTGEGCGDAGEDEVKICTRVDLNDDGDFGDGGVEDWACQTSSDATDHLIWAAEPGANEIRYGITNGTHSQDIWVDDVQFSTSKPGTW